MNVQERFDKTIKDCKRVLKVSRKPDKQEYLEFSKIGSNWNCYYWCCWVYNCINW